MNDCVNIWVSGVCEFEFMHLCAVYACAFLSFVCLMGPELGLGLDPISSSQDLSSLQDLSGADSP